MFVRSTALLLLVMMVVPSCVQGPSVTEPSHVEPVYALVLDEADFDSLVVRQGRDALVEFYLPGCSVCEEMGWIIDTLARRYGEHLLVGVTDAKANTLLAQRYDVQTVPSFLYFSNTEVVARRVYLQDWPDALDTLDALVRALLDGLLVPDTTDTLLPPDTTGPGSSNVRALDISTFDSLVITTPGVAMVDFYMPTCPACVAMDQIVDTLAVLFDGKALVGKYNTTIDFSLPRLYGVQYVPTFIFFRNGSEYHRHTGVESRESLAAWIQMGLDAEDNPGGDE